VDPGIGVQLEEIVRRLLKEDIQESLHDLAAVGAREQAFSEDQLPPVSIGQARQVGIVVSIRDKQQAAVRIDGADAIEARWQIRGVPAHMDQEGQISVGEVGSSRAHDG